MIKARGLIAPLPPQAQQRPRHKPWLLVITLCLGTFMVTLDITIVTIAIPTLGTALHAPLDQLVWITNIYVLVLAVLMITAARLGDRYGPRRIFVIGVVTFTLASAACGLAQAGPHLIAGRAVQGVGAALLTPQAMSLISLAFPEGKRGTPFGVIGAVAGLGLAAGPALGGFLVASGDWRWIFFMNVPIGMVTVVLTVVAMAHRKPDRPHRLDWTGTVLATTGLFLLSYGLIEGQPHAWGTVRGPVTIPLVIAAGIAVLTAFICHQYATRAREPLIPFSIFKHRNYALACLLTGAYLFGLQGLFLPLVFYLQSVLDQTALQAGLMIAPMWLAVMAASFISGRLDDRTDPKWLLVTGFGSYAAGMLMVIAATNVDGGQRQLLLGLVVVGLGIGCIHIPLQTLAMRHIKPHLVGAAAGVSGASRQLGSLIGGVAVGALLQAQLASRLVERARQNAAELPAEYRAQLITGFEQAGRSDADMGTWQSLAATSAGPPTQADEALAHAAEITINQGLADAIHTTLLLPASVLVVAMLSSLLIDNRTRGRSDNTGAGALQ